METAVGYVLVAILAFAAGYALCGSLGRDEGLHHWRQGYQAGMYDAARQYGVEEE